MSQEKKNIHKAVFGIYKSRIEAELGVETLKSAGFRSSDVSVLLPDREGTKNFAHDKATKVPEGVTTGAASGIVLGGAFGWLVGIGSLAIPGIGPFVAAGPIMAALAGVGVGGTVGGIAGALIGMGIPEYEAKRYEEQVKTGGILLSVHVGDSDVQKKAKEILKSTGAEDIDTESEVKERGSNKSRATPQHVIR